MKYNVLFCNEILLFVSCRRRLIHVVVELKKFHDPCLLIYHFGPFLLISCTTQCSPTVCLFDAVDASHPPKSSILQYLTNMTTLPPTPKPFRLSFGSLVKRRSYIHEDQASSELRQSSLTPPTLLARCSVLLPSPPSGDGLLGGLSPVVCNIASKVAQPGVDSN